MIVIDCLLGPMYMFSQLSLPLMDGSTQTVLAKEPIKELALVMNAVLNISIVVDNHNYSLTDFCLRPVPSGNIIYRRYAKKNDIKKK